MTNTVKTLQPRPEEEVYPYRRVWRSITIENSILVVVVLALIFIPSFLGIQIPKSFQQPINVVLSLLPAILWMIFSRLQERRAIQPRKGLLSVAIVSALVANAIGIPLVQDFLKVGEWLSLSSAIDRIISYTLTVGMIQELLKYLVIRYVAWPGQFRIRLDGVAFGVASAIGYATVQNLHFAIDHNIAVDAMAQRLLITMAMHMGASVIISYGLSELRFGTPTPFMMPFMLGVGAFIVGVAVPVRAGLVNASFSLNGVFTRPTFGLGFSLVLLVAPMLLMAWLYDNAERREQERLASMEL
ncbi:MAG: PrsW family intramembrane metalloprotease [Chloroflexi bacterium]|nr:MAG: PrsW family intramembrane metalloprotease [Chloroflexota bacterium]